ncbi:MAG: FAD-binding oxidoreductase, partial [Candidatus Obscuribacterales bacterium]|nr:FAD-binding oxidoreductase [Steroidobacteraceae bacterium]
MSDTPSSAWENYGWDSLPSLVDDMHADVCVIGMGGSGLSAVHTLLDCGASVVGIDANQVAGGAAGANGGFLLAGTARFYHQTIETLGHERARELYRLTVQEIERMQRAMPDIVRRVGSLRIAMSAEELTDCDKQFAAMTADNLPVERYKGEEGDGLLIPTDGVFDPLARCRRLARSALQRGARIYEQTPALDIQSGIVQTPHARVHCKHIVVTVDGKLDLVFPELKHRVRTARWGYEYWQQLPTGCVLLGGFRDHAIEDEWTYSTQ